MITVLFHLTTKPGTQTDDLFREMTQVSRADQGCISYTFHRQLDDPRQWVLYEQWQDKSALEAHVATMKAVFGEPPPGARLPARIDAISESFRAVRYQVLA